jgi:hypothetical protein
MTYGKQVAKLSPLLPTDIATITDRNAPIPPMMKGVTNLLRLSTTIRSFVP